MARTATAQLGVPPHWADDLAGRRLGDLRLDVAVSYTPRTRLPAGVDLDREVAADLLAGATLDRRDTHYSLSGTRFELRLADRTGRNSGRPMAFCFAVEERVGVPRRQFPFRAEVSFWDVGPRDAEEPYCDLAEVDKRIRADRRRRGAGERRAARDVRSTARPAALNTVARLQAAAEAEYGSLRMMLDLLRLRATRNPAEAEAVVVPADPVTAGEVPPVMLRAVARADGFDDQLVEVMDGADRLCRTRVREVRDGDLLVLEPPDDWRPAPGDRVLIRVVPRFALRRHDEAVRRFLRQEVEGSWPDLARLLCLPGDLVPPEAAPPPARFACDSDPGAEPLNDAQRRAVAGALATPHAFLIQGPPGTGKTSVICELVRQLVDRGERVLLLAPTHVAVDEVLTRIGYRPGVRPVRLAHHEGKVAPAALPFVADRVGANLSRIVRQRPSRAATWRAEDERVAEELGLVEALAGLGQDLRAATAERVAAATALDRLRAGAATERKERTEAVAEAHRRLVLAEESATATAAAAETAAERFASEYAAARALVDGLRRALSGLHVAAGAAATALADEAAAGGDLTRAEAGFGDRLAGISRETEEREAVRRAAYERAVDAYRQSERLAGELAARAAPGAVERLAQSLGLGPVPRLRRALDAAQREHAAATADWSAADARLRVLASEHARLTAERDRVSIALRGVLADRSAARVAAVTRWRDAAAATWRAGVDESAFDPRDPGAVARLARDLERWLAGAVERGLASPPDGLRVVSTPLARLWKAGRDRDGRAAARREAAAERVAARAALDRATTDATAAEERLADALAAADERLSRAESRLTATTEAHRRALSDLGYRRLPPEPEVAARAAALRRRRHVLSRLPELEQRWRQYIDAAPDDLTEDMARSYLNSANLVCATTTGVAGSPVVRGADFDTLVVDEASKVTESEFLIGAVRTRRWVLVGDERQLPPYVEPADEHHLHALAALDRAERGGSTLEQAVAELAGIWEEDEEEHAFRVDSVAKAAAELRRSGAWDGEYRASFVTAHRRLAGRDGDPDRTLLAAMRRHLVRSLFERVAAGCPPQLRQSLVEQRRMVADLAAVVRDPVYAGRYETPEPADLARHGVTPLVTAEFDRPLVALDTSLVPNAEEQPTGSGGFTNRAEQDAVVWACERYHRGLRDMGAEPVTVSVLSFYKPQARAIRRRLEALDLPLLRFEVVDAVDKIQGQQSQLVMVSFTRARKGPVGRRYGQWLKDIRRLNVACTRAQRALVVVAHLDTLRRVRDHTHGPVRAFYDNLLDLLGDRERSTLLREFR